MTAEIRMKTAHAVKRLFDIVLALFLLLVLSPLLLVIGTVIRLTSRGSAVFKQQRVGYLGKPFVIYKFRTMVCTANPESESPTTLMDRRITGTGRLLRRYHLDELPQLLNILKGEMSFVGPRAQLQKELRPLEADCLDQLCKRLAVRPGLTSSWAVTRGTVKHLPTREMIETDCRYVDECNPWMDARIILQTLVYLVAGDKQR